jgi:hypothetical protein
VRTEDHLQPLPDLLGYADCPTEQKEVAVVGRSTGIVTAGIVTARRCKLTQSNNNSRANDDGSPKIADDVDAERYIHSIIGNREFQDLAVHAYRISRSCRRSIRESIHAAMRTTETLWEQAADQNNQNSDGGQEEEKSIRPPNPGREKYRTGVSANAMLHILNYELTHAGPSIGKEMASPEEIADIAVRYVDALLERLER